MNLFVIDMGEVATVRPGHCSFWSAQCHQCTWEAKIMCQSKRPLGVGYFKCQKQQAYTNRGMELDTGSAVTLVSEHTFRSKWPDMKLTVQYNEQTANLSLIIEEENGQSLFGRDWLAQICIDSRESTPF